jgi:hypothetical protein
VTHATNIDCPTRHAGTIYGDGWNLALVFADGGISPGRAEANANLMVAAPDMFHALEVAGSYLNAFQNAVQYRQTSSPYAPVATGYEYVEIPLWAIRQMTRDIAFALGRAQGMETGTAETGEDGLGAKPDSPTPQGDALETSGKES